MKIRDYMIVAGVAAGCFVGGCANKVQRSPALVKEKEAAPAAAGVEQKGFLTRAGETTVDVVTAPVRLVTPEKKPKKEPEKWEAAEVIMLGGQEEVAGATGEAATRPGGK